jgi:hypothetical protein
VRIGSNSFLGAFFLIILLLSLFLSIFGSVGVFYGESYHVVVILEANPQRYVDNVLHIFLYLILPIAASLTFFIITCIKRRETPTEGLSNWLLIIFGGFCVLWGYRYFEASYVSYFNTIMMAHDWHISNIDGSLLAIYTAYGLVGILWLITGVVFIITSAHKLLKSRRACNNKMRSLN